MEGLKNLDHESDDGRWCIELTAHLALGASELAEEVLVDAPEGVEIETDGNLGNFLQQFFEQRAGEEVVGLGQDAGELGIVLLDIAHRSIDFRSDVFGFRAVE